MAARSYGVILLTFGEISTAVPRRFEPVYNGRARPEVDVFESQAHGKFTDSVTCISDLEDDLCDGNLSSIVGHGNRGPIDAGDREYHSSLRPDS